MLRHRLSLFVSLTAGIVMLAGSAAAQFPGKASLKGAYNVRYLGVNTSPSDQAVSFGGTVTFDGNGGFTVSGQGASVATGNLKFLATGQYTVLSNGLFQMTNPFDASSTPTFAQASTVLYGGLGGNGVVVASSTDTYYCDLLVAIPAAAALSNATLSGNYYVTSLEFLNGSLTANRDTFFPMTADGKGGLGNVTIQGTASSLSDAATSQTSTAATYTVSANGTGTMTFPAPSGVAAGNVLLSGSKALSVSSDGSFFIAGGATAYDMVIGVKALTGNPGAAQTGLYFTGFLQNIPGTASGDGVYAGQGASNILSTGIEIGHQRTNYEAYAPYGYDYTFDEDDTPAANGTAIYDFSQYVIGAGGNFLIGAGASSNYEIAIYVKITVPTGTGVFLTPQGVVNAANSVPFTAGISPGEVISLFGSGMATSTAVAGLPFPTTLGGASVTISYVDSNNNNTVNLAAPIYSASPTLINAVVPYTAPSDGTFLNIKVTSGGTDSNVATFYSSVTSPGIFTYPVSGGVGDGAIEHADGSVVTTASPAKAGETVVIFLTGLGAVTPAVTAGTAAPASPLSTADIPDVYIDGIQATVLFAGLTPGSGGLYQLNVTIPAGVTTGGSDVIEVVTYDADNAEATIPIGK